MAYVRDLWTKPNPENPRSKKHRLRNDRWGIGNRWQATWEENGKRATKSFSSRDAATAWCSRVDVGQDEGTWITKDKREILLSDMWKIWFATKSGKAKSTRDGYSSAWKRIEPRYGTRSCASITRSEIAAWLPSLTTTKGVEPGEPPRPLSGGMQRKVGIVINALLETAVEEGVIHTNPMRTKDIPQQGESDRRYLTVPEVDRLLKAAPTDEAWMLTRVLLWTGVRPGEGKGFKVKDLAVHRGRLRVRRDVDDLGNDDETKTGRHRDVPCGGDLLLDLEDLAEGRDPEDRLLTDEHGNTWTETRWRRVWAVMTDETGIDITPHGLRHTAVSMAIHAGANVHSVQRMVGHSQPSTTMNIYGHLWDDQLDTLPGAMEEHMKAERQRFRQRAERKQERESGGDFQARRRGRSA